MVVLPLTLHHVTEEQDPLVLVKIKLNLHILKLHCLGIYVMGYFSNLIAYIGTHIFSCSRQPTETDE